MSVKEIIQKPVRLLNIKEKAAELGVTPETLRTWRLKGRGPAYVRYGPKMVRYFPADPDDFTTGAA